jgi:hypothetical protein
MGASGQQPPPVMLGGGGAKVSEAYEEAWNQFTLLDLIVGLGQKMQPEPPGTAGYGFEFWVDRADRREWHQVKYQHGRSGRWNLNDLYTVGVLGRFRDKLQVEPQAACCFVSAHSATPLDLLCARAGQADTLSRFLDTFVAQAELGSDFENLWKERWNVTAEEAWQWLRSSILVRALDWMSLQDRLSERIRVFVEGRRRSSGKRYPNVSSPSCTTRSTATRSSASLPIAGVLQDTCRAPQAASHGASRMSRANLCALGTKTSSVRRFSPARGRRHSLR